MVLIRICEKCNEQFIPNKYRRQQKVCSKPECQRKRQLDDMSLWREQNPNYFRDAKILWRQLTRERARIWRQRNKRKQHLYRQTHKEDIRLYMREYMRRYRNPSGGKPVIITK